MKKINCYILSALTCFLVLTSPAQAAFDPTDTTTDYFKTSVDNLFDESRRSGAECSRQFDL